MRFKRYTGISWSTVELAGLLEDQDSLVTFERTRKHFGLHPFHLSNLHAAVNEILSAKLNCYDNELKGFILAYKNPKLVGPLGEILYDTCFIHVDVEVDFYVFRPTVGCSLKGIVNKKGLDHVGVLVHKAFNVSIPNRGKRAGLAAEEEDEGEEEDDWPGHKVSIGQEIRFTVTDIDLNSRIPIIRGSLDKRDYLSGCALALNGECPPQLATDLLNEQDENETTNGPAAGRKKKNKKTSREKKFFSSDSENNWDENEERENGEAVDSEKMAKPKSPTSTDSPSSRKSTKEHSKKSKKREQAFKAERESSEERRIRKDRRSERKSREKLVKVEERMEEENADETAELRRSESVERKSGKRKAEKLKVKLKREGSVTGLEDETIVKSETIVRSSDSEVSAEDRKKPTGRKKKGPREWSGTIEEEEESKERAVKREERRERVKVENSYVDEDGGQSGSELDIGKREFSVKKIKVERAGSILDNDQEEGDPIEAADTTRISEHEDQSPNKEKKKKKKKRRKEEEAEEGGEASEGIKIKSEPEEWWYNVRVKKEITDTQSEGETSDRGKHREPLVKERKDSGSGEELRLENVKIKVEKNWER